MNIRNYINYAIGVGVGIFVGYVFFHNPPRSVHPVSVEGDSRQFVVVKTNEKKSYPMVRESASQPYIPLNEASARERDELRDKVLGR